MEEFRKTAPAPLAPISFNLAKPFETTLPNGLKVVIFENKRLPLVNFRLAFKSGAVNDPAELPGITEALAKMLNEGTKIRTSKQIAEEVEKIGGALNASASADNTIIAASALAVYAPEILNLMADVVLGPSFPEKELGIYRENTKEELKLQRAQADFLAGERTAKILFGEHPYSVVSTTPAVLDAVTGEKLAGFHRRAFIPNNAVFIAVGDVDSENLLKEITALFGDWQKGELNGSDFPAPPARAAKTLTIVNRPNSSQANIVLGNIAIKRTDPDHFALMVMNMVLGGGASSRLFMNLREEKGYTYGAYSTVDARRLTGVFEATAEVRTAVAGDSLKEFFHELERIRTEPVPENEINDAKNYIAGSFPLRVETQEGLTNQIVSQQVFGLPEDYLQTYRDKINAVTAADVQRVAQKYIQPDKLAIVIVGDAGQLLEQVKPYAQDAENIEIYDAEGNLKNMNDFVVDANTPPANMAGKWTLNVEAMGQTLQIALDLQQDGNNVSGKMESALVSGDINGTVAGNSFNAASKTEVMGQEVEMNMAGTVEGDSITGSINAGLPGIPDLPFNGNR
jgi:zinc protease